MNDTELEGGDVLCSEGTRHCRDGRWSGCEDVHQYIAAPSADTQRVIELGAGKLSCSICDVKCFQIVDHLLADGGVAGGNVTFGPGGGITLLPGDGGTAGPGGDAGGSGLTGCAAMMACCSTLSDALKSACEVTALDGDDAICDRDRFAYCPSGTVTGPVQGCTVGSGADSDCDGIPNVVDAVSGKPLATTNNQAIFHQLDVGESGSNALEISFKLRNADVYFLLDMTNTMKEERDNLISSLTTGNVINCAHLNQCCNRLPDGATKTACEDVLATYTNRANQADDQTACLNAQTTYCPGNVPVDCPDDDGNGLPDNHLKTQGVVGATRCLVGSSWFGAGFALEAPIQADPIGCSSGSCSRKYADRDEQLFKNVIDLTPDYSKVSTALQSMTTNGNWDEPEGGLMGLYSVITGRGHYFGINRPSIPPRIATTACPPNSFGYPCFRKDAVPIIVFFTDRPHHNGPTTIACASEGNGCPYNALSGPNTTTWSSGAAESASDKQARFVPLSAETFSTAYNAGDVRGQYVTLVGDTRFMAGDYPTTLIGCSAATDAPDALIRFRVSAPAGATGTVAPIPINFRLTKDDVYSASLYGTWRTDRANDPSPATEFGSVLSVFRGVPNAVASNNDLGDRQAFAIASGPDSTYLTYTGTTMGTNSGPGFLGGLSNCSADGLTNQMLFTFRPTANARIVVDASGSSFPSVVSLHSGLPGSLPKNPSTSDGTSVGIVNTNDTFATANAVPSGATSIDGAYVERKGDSNVASINSDYSALLPRTIYGKRTTDSDTLTEVASTTGLEPGMVLNTSTHWTAMPVQVISVGTDTVKLSARWQGDPPPDPEDPPVTDGAPVALTFLDTLVGCGVDGAGKDTVFKFNVATPRRVRIDTEGSTYDTVISLHDAPPPTIVAKSDVAGNASAPGYSIGEVHNASYTLDALGAGTDALTSNYDYNQCGAGKASKDAVFRFTLNSPTHLGLDVTPTSSWSPVVGLFSSPPGTIAALDNAANNNDSLTAPSAAFDLGDVYGAVDTTVVNSNLSGMNDDWLTAVVGCDATAPSRDQIFKFTPLESTRVRVIARSSGSSWNPVVAVFDDPPPSASVVTTSTAFDIAAVTLPDANCLAYSYHDPAGAAPAHTYAVCPTKYYSNDANTRCVNAGMSYLASINTAAEQSFLLTTSVASYSTSNFHIGAIDPEGDGIFAWRDGTALGYANWLSGEPNGTLINNKCADLRADLLSNGPWIDGKCTSSGAALSDSAYYICEDSTPTVLPNDDAATAQAVPAGTTRVVTGSTRRMANDYNGAVLLSACGGTSFGGDAVFSITTDAVTSYQLGIDSAGSSYSVVLGLFENTIDAAGYRGCDAFGGGALTYTLLPSRTYYVVVKGTALSQEGNYKLKFSNLSAATPDGTQLSCARATASLPSASVDVDVDANHTYYVVVDHADATFGKYDLEVHSLYLTRSEVANASSSNETGETALALPDPYRSRITVIDTTTAGMSADYGNSANGMCTASPSAPDAVYKFTPSLTTNVTFTVKPEGVGLNNPAIGVFDGPPGTSAVSHDLNATGNLNEAGPSAEAVPLTGPAQLYLGNTSAMAANVDPSLLQCGALPNGHDAVFSFNLAQQTNVEIDASASGVSDPVINLFRSGPLSKPTRVTLENDTKQAADSNPTPTPSVSSSWLYYGADFGRLSAESQAALSVVAVNDDAPPATQQPQDLGDISGKRLVISGGDTGPMRADYPALSCAGVDAAADALYKFSSSTSGTVHVKATPQSGFDGVIGLFDGTNGLPVRLSDRASLIEDAACVPSSGPRNVSNATLKSINAALAAAPDINVNCGNTAILTNDPDGAGARTVTLQDWCGTEPTVLTQPQADGPELVIFVTKSLQIASGSILRVLGERPVLFVVSGVANVAGQLTTTPNPSFNPGVPGAGGDSGCGASYGGNAQSSDINSGGGGGGGFATAGGQGGFGSSSSVAGGPGGAARANATLTPLVGGCSGGDGAFGSSGGLAAGAVQISATTSIVLGGSASIVADGGSGVIGASGQAGGSGGGSGGAILLQSPTVTYLASQLSARGGTGGQGLGSPMTGGGTGAATNAAAGGAGQDSNAAAGGGGGGGGYGRVVVVPTAAVSLAPCTVATNENASSAWPILLDGTGREYIERGDTVAMAQDHGGMCGTPATSPDAVYAFTLSKPTTVQIDGRASANGTAIGLFNASSLGQSPVPTLLENDDRAAADANPAPTPDAINTWLAYRGDLQNLTASGQPQTSIDNSGNANEIIPSELPDPIDRRITILNANTSAMSADFLAPSCSMPAADTARDAIYRFVPSKGGPVRVSANYSQTLFDPVIALYRGAHEVIDERLLLINETESTLAKLNVDASTVKVYNLARTVLYTTSDYTVVARDANTPVVIKRTASTTIPNYADVSVDYVYDSGAPLPISQQQVVPVDLGVSGNTNEDAVTAAQVPILSGQAYVYTGDTTAMSADVDGALFTCGPPAVGSRDATFDFSLEQPTTVSISTEGSSYDTTIAVFSGAYTRPSTTVIRSPAPFLSQLYDVRRVPGAPEATCSPYDYSSSRYWICSTARPWEQAEGLCRGVGLHLATIDNAPENAALRAEIASTTLSHHIGFAETVPYTNSWGAWTSGGGGTTGSTVSGRFVRWTTNEPNGSGDCAQMLSDGTWDDADCALTKSYVCERNDTTPTAAPSGSTCGSALTYGGHLYYACTDEQDWTTAAARCTSVGMRLARVDDQAEDDQLRVLIAGSPAWIGGSDTATEGNWVWSDNAGFWIVTAFRNWAAGEPDQITTNPGSRMLPDTGQWVDTPVTSQSFPYICEDPVIPSTEPVPPTASSPQLVDVFSARREFTGSTEGVASSVGGFISSSGCVGAGAAADAVFQIPLTYRTTLSVDITGSYAGSLVGLFREEFSTQGYTDAGSRCGLVASAAPQLTATVDPGTYYVVLTAASVSPTASGVYNIRFDAQTTDAAAFTMRNDTLLDAQNDPLGSVDGKWLVKKSDMAGLTPTVGAITPVDMGTGTDTNDLNAQSLGSIDDNQVIVTNASTGDLTPNYPAGACNLSASGADALYSFTAADNDPIQVRFTPSGWSGQVVVYDGAPPTSSNAPQPPISLAPAYSNEAPGTAQSTPVAVAQAYLGNLTMMANDVPSSAFNQSFNAGAGSPTTCSADPTGSDAFFKFTVMDAAKQVEISSAGSAIAHTIALWDSKPFTRPTATTVQYDTRTEANMAGAWLGSGDDIDDDWAVVRGNTTMLTPYNGYSPRNETVDYPHDDSIHDLGDVNAQHVVTVNATTTGLAADYLASTLQCGGSSDTSPDAVFSFSHSLGGRVRLSLNNPTAAFPANLALFRGAPLTAVDTNPPQIAVPNTNEALTSAYVADAVAGPKIYTGTTAAMLNNYTGSVFTQGSAYGSSVCNPDGAGRDAFMRFTLPSTKTVEITSLSASFDQTIALWDATPIVAPTAAAMSHDTRSAAYTTPIGVIDNDWVVKTATMTGLFPDALVASTPAVANNDEVQDLGNPTGRRIAVAGDTGPAGVLADFSTAAVTCASSDTPADIIYKIRPTANTSIRAALNNPSNPAFNAAISVLNGGTGHPQRMLDTTPAAATTAYCGGSNFGYTPSNFPLGSAAGQVSFSTAANVLLTGCGTITYDSDSDSWSPSFCGQTKPPMTVVSQADGPSMAVLAFKSLDIAAGTTLVLRGSRAVAFAVEGNATIAGTINASASGTTPGAGGNWSCGTADGNDGTGSSSAGGGGGGGGAFGTNGGTGGYGDNNGNQGTGGSARGNTNITPLYGGCNGGRGGGCSALGAAGGGAVQISAGAVLTVSGSVVANGGTGATGCGSEGGGTGGGSGGGIFLEGGTVNVTGALTANGGRGGNGGSGGNGGNGSTSAASPGSTGQSDSTNGGGGGGGGYGRIRERVAPCVPAIEDSTTAQVVPIGLTQTYTGPGAGMASDLAGTSFNSGGCSPDLTGPDAFWKFTLTRTTNVEVRAQGSNYNHTLALFNSSMVAQACNDGTAATGGTITRSLAAGTYYVGIKSRNAGVGGDFTVAFRDTTAGPPYSPVLGCATTSATGYVDASLTANTDYYIIVKGAASGQSGAYNLVVTDIGAVQAPSCGDPTAPDAYFDFEVSDAAGRNVTISLDETVGKLDGSFQLMRDVAPLNDVSGDVAVSGCQSSSFTYTGLTPGRYYVIVRGAAIPGTSPAEISIRDEGGMNALDCMNANSGAAGTITRTLPAGTYYAGITSRNGAAGGTYRLQIRDTSIVPTTGGSFVACADGSLNLTYDIPPADANVPYYAVVKGAIAGASGAYTLAVADLSSVQDLCDSGDSIQMDPMAPDAYYAFNVTDADGGGRDVTVSLASSSALDGAYRLFRVDAPTVFTPVGSCHDRSAPYTYTDLAAGNYYVVLRGKSAASGGANDAFELSINDQDAYGSLECRDGVATSGTTITRILDPGDYWVGIKPQAGQSDPKDYRLQFRDVAEPAPTTATEVACGTGVVNANVTAGNTYYVLVKGNSALVSGEYGLVVTDLGGSAGWNCNDDSAAGDAYFEFNVDDPDGRRVTIDTEGSALDTVVAIFPAGATIGAAGVLQCDDDSGATAGSSKITRDLAPGVYYAVVRPRLGAPDPNLAFELSIRDESVYSSVACGATSPSGKAQVRTTLGPGTYHTVLKGMAGSAQGAYKIRFRDETPYLNAASEVACNDAQNELVYNVTAGKPYYAVVKGAATNESGPYRLTVENLVARNGMGCDANPASPDAVYRFRLSQDARVQIDTTGSQTSDASPVPTDTVIALYDLTASYFGTNYANDRLGSPVNCDDDSGDAAKGWSRITADLAGNRDYYVVVKSKSSGWGGVTSLPYVVNVRDLDTNQPIACASTNTSLLMTESLPAGDYRVVVSTLNGASGGAPFDVRFRNITAASSGATQVACADTPEEFTYDVVAGRPYYLMVKGDAANDRGQYGLVVETAGSGATSMGCGASPAAPDAFFKFQLATRATVAIDTEDSTADTVMALYPGNAGVFGTNYALDANGAVVPCDDDGGISEGASRIQADLAAGTYYVVVKGKTLGWDQTSQAFNLSLRDLTNTGSIACASSSEGNKRIVQDLAPGDYQVVMSTASAAGGAYSLKFRDTALAGAQSGSLVSCVASGSLSVNNLIGGREYYLVVKGNTATDSGSYSLTMEDTVSSSAASGSTSVACAATGMMIDGTYPAGTYYALVTGQNASDSGPYSLRVRDLDALQDQNRLACDDNGGPNKTSVIERDLKAGTHYVVVKGQSEDARGAYTLHVRDADAVPDRELACGGAEESERLQADVQAGQDYTVLLKGDASAATGNYDIKLYDQTGLQTGTGQNLKCLADPRPTTLYNSDWHRKAVDFDLSLTPDTYYVAVKGQRTTDKGTFQLQIGEKSARTTTTYTPPTWTEIKDALEASSARVLPVIATGGETDSSVAAYVTAVELQAQAIAKASKAERKDGSAIWQRIHKTGRGTGSGLITGIAELADYLAMDVSLVAIDGPDPGASKFRIDIAPVTSPSCAPHPLVDTSTGACTSGAGALANYSCNTQYKCAPGSAPKFSVTFTNPSDAPVPANPNDPYGGYHFRLQIFGDKKYLLDEVPVYIIPTSHTPIGPPGGSGAFQSSGTYEQDITEAACPTLSSGGVVTNDLPQWSDLYFSAGLPEGTSIEMELCTKESPADLAGCTWSDGGSPTRKKVTVRSKGTCASEAQCRGVDGYGDGFCASGTCQFISEPKVAYDIACTENSQCPNGNLGAGEFLISSRCETTRGALGYGHCVYSSQPADMGATLPTGEQGRPFARVRFVLRSDSTGSQAPTLYQWNLTYYCKSAQ